MESTGVAVMLTSCGCRCGVTTKSRDVVGSDTVRPAWSRKRELSAKNRITRNMTLISGTTPTSAGLIWKLRSSFTARLVALLPPLDVLFRGHEINDLGRFAPVIG